MFVSGLYFGLFILSLIASYIMLYKMSVKKIAYYGSLFILITVVCLAYFAYSIAIDTGTALAANEFTYLDGTFVMMLFLFCIMDMCGFNVPVAVSAPLCLINIGFLIVAFTSGYHNLFVTNYEIAHALGASHLSMELGPVYIAYIVYDVLYVIAVLGIVIHSVVNRKKISYKQTLVLGGIMASIIILYFVQFVLGLPFDLLPISYVVMEFGILAVVKRIGVYDVTSIAVSANEENKDFGCIVLDNGKNYIGANEAAKYYFPQLKDLQIDMQIGDDYIKREFVDWVDAYNKGNTSSKLYSIEDKKILCKIRTYEKGKRKYGYIISMRDDTEEQEYIDRLNIVNEELALSVEQLDNAAKAKSQFLANMSHEIRTPINAIIGMNEIAMRECSDKSVISYMQDIESASNHLLGIINDILDFSKIEAGKIDFILEDYDLGLLIKEVEDLVKKKAEDKGLNLKICCAEDIPCTLRGDKNRISQVLVNLLNNAVKYTHEGSVTMSVSRGAELEGKTELVISVADTGIGIKKENIGELFESFTRIEESRNRKIEGTGLGLAITKKLVEGMRGHIEVESVYNEGSTFTVFIPQSVINPEPIGDYKKRAQVARNTKSSADIIKAPGVKILIVDDNSMNLKVAKGLLKPTLAEVTLALSGKECLELIKDTRFDMVFLDHMMPEMDGIETLARARKEDNLCKDVPFIALTANAIAGARDEFINAGFDEYLSKPVKPGELYEMVKKYMPSR